MKTIHAIRAFLFTQSMLFGYAAFNQELYVFTEPASNMPARSISTKLSGMFVRDAASKTIAERLAPEIMLGLNGRWMVHGALTFSNMFSAAMRPESARLYAKYRFYSNDEVHRHFRMAAFSEASHSRNELLYEELSFDGDQSGLQTGVVATQLLGRVAVSSSLSYLWATGEKPKTNVNSFVFQAYNFSLSTGYLLLPVTYNSFRQTNVNLYAELLGERATDRGRYFLDLAPAVQFIFNSNFKLDVGYRFQIAGDMYRMADAGVLVSAERTFLSRMRSAK